MDNTIFGLTMLVVGMGGTLASLFFITLVICALTAFFPVRPGKEEEKK